MSRARSLRREAASLAANAAFLNSCSRALPPREKSKRDAVAGARFAHWARLTRQRKACCFDGPTRPVNYTSTYRPGSYAHAGHSMPIGTADLAPLPRHRYIDGWLLCSLPCCSEVLRCLAPWPVAKNETKIKKFGGGVFDTHTPR